MTKNTKFYYINETINKKVTELELFYLAQQRAEDVRIRKASTVSWKYVKTKNNLQD